jgi:cytochrome c oxidase assembly protein subunit 15
VTSGRSSRLARGVFVANLVAQMAIVVTGAVVRLTGSGLGCPTWPQCVEGSYVPTSRQEEEWHKYVEFGNRLLTFVLAALAIAAVVVAVVGWRRNRRRSVLLLALVPLIGTAIQAVLGGVTVLTGLHPATVAAHFLGSMAILVACVALVARSRDPGDHPVVLEVPRAVRGLTWLMVVAAGAVVVVGVLVTGSGPHSGDAEAENRFSFDPRTVAWLHADLVLLFLGLLIGLLVALHVTHATRRARRPAWILLAVSLAQGAVGYLQYFTGLPVALVAFHVLGAVIVWVAVLFVPFGQRTRGSAQERVDRDEQEQQGQIGDGPVEEPHRDGSHVG